jgi:hypothetical protein
MNTEEGRVDDGGEGGSIWNQGRMKDTASAPSAPVSRKTTTRFLESIMLPGVCQSLRFTGSEGGTYARSDIALQTKQFQIRLESREVAEGWLGHKWEKK